MSGVLLSPPVAATAVPAPGPAPRTADEAGRAFEALVLAELLRSARASAELMGRSTPGADARWRELAERRAAEALAASSPLGLAALLARAAADDPQGTP
jgi:hypothetical protein